MTDINQVFINHPYNKYITMSPCSSYLCSPDDKNSSCKNNFFINHHQAYLEYNSKKELAQLKYCSWGYIPIKSYYPMYPKYMRDC